jgi:hypothetical protein
MKLPGSFSRDKTNSCLDIQQNNCLLVIDTLTSSLTCTGLVQLKGYYWLKAKLVSQHRIDCRPSLLVSILLTEDFKLAYYWELYHSF